MRWLYSHRKQLTVILILVVTLLLFPRLRTITVDDIINYTPSSPLLAMFSFIGLYCLRPVLMAIPNLVLCIAIGIIFSPLQGILISLIGIFCETTISYFIGWKLGAKEVTKLVEKNEKVRKFLSSNQNNNTATCFLARITPLPIGLTSMFFGAAGMPWSKYIFASVLGLAPKMIPYVLAGTAIDNPLSVEFLLPFGISFLITFAVFIIYRKVTSAGVD